MEKGTIVSFFSVSSHPHSKYRNMESKRYFYLDLLRIIATFGVIFTHLSMDTNHWHIAIMYDGLVRWSVPIFVMISGTLFLNPCKELSIYMIIRKYVKRLLLAYLFWYLFYCVFKYLCIGFDSNSWELSNFSFTPRFHLWFLPMLMCIYLLIPILKKISGNKDLLLYALIIWMFCLTFSFLNIKIPQVSGLFTMNQVAGYAGYFLLGYFLATNSWVGRSRLIIYSLGILGVLATVLGSVFLSFHKGFFSARFLLNVSPHVVLMASALFVFVKQHEPQLENRLGGFTRYVQKDLFGIYLVHVFWIKLFDCSFIWNSCNHVVLIPIMAIVVFLFSLYSTKLLRYVPFLSRFVR